MGAIIDNKYLLAVSLIFANVLTGPLVDEIQEVFGAAVWHHPLTIWIVLLSLVYINTKSWKAALAVVVGYEALKFLWRLFKPEAPHIARLRKLLSNAAKDQGLDDDDIRFIDKVTPSSVTFARKEA